MPSPNVPSLFISLTRPWHPWRVGSADGICVRCCWLGTAVTRFDGVGVGCCCGKSGWRGGAGDSVAGLGGSVGLLGTDVAWLGTDVARLGTEVARLGTEAVLLGADVARLGTGVGMVGGSALSTRYHIDG